MAVNVNGCWRFWAAGVRSKERSRSKCGHAQKLHYRTQYARTILSTVTTEKSGSVKDAKDTVTYSTARRGVAIAEATSHPWSVECPVRISTTRI